MSDTYKKYPLDYTGTSPDNLVRNEAHVLSGTNVQDFQIIFPKVGPYYKDSLQIEMRSPTGEVINLQRGRDWIWSHKFQTASHSLAKPVYASISFTNRKLRGVVYITYQNLGGEWVLDYTEIEQILLERIHNPTVTYWENIVDLPRAFPPIAHTFDVIDIYGEGHVLEALNGIAEAIRGKTVQGTPLNPSNNSAIVATKRELGLERVRNIGTLPIDVNDDDSDNFLLTPASLNNLLPNKINKAVTKAMEDYVDKTTYQRELAEKLNTTSTASNSNKLDNKTYDEVVKDVTKRVTQNFRIGEYSPSQFLEQVALAANSAATTTPTLSHSLEVSQPLSNQSNYTFTYKEGTMYKLTIDKVPTVVFHGFKRNQYCEMLLEVTTTMPSGNALNYERAIFNFTQPFNYAADMNSTRPGKKIIRVSSSDGGATFFVHVLSSPTQYK